MKSIAQNEFIVINFLVRHFTERYTIRNIAEKLKLSAAGVHSILKKLEKASIVSAEKLGTGLFYNINFGNKVAKHIAAIVLLSYYGDIKKIDIEQIKDEINSAIFDNKNLLLIKNEVSRVDEIAHRLFKDYEVIVKTDDGFIEAIKQKDKVILDVIKNGCAVYGENYLISLLGKIK